MADIAEASLTGSERGAVERLISTLRAELGDELIAVWLFGSRARGEPRRAESDIDLVVVTRRGERGQRLLGRIAVDAELAADEGGIDLMPHAVDPEHLEDRRQIRSFFMQELDRDKVVLYEKTRARAPRSSWPRLASAWQRRATPSPLVIRRRGSRRPTTRCSTRRARR